MHRVLWNSQVSPARSCRTSSCPPRLTRCCCRSLGVHLSKVRSLTLDSWEAEQLKVTTTLHGAASSVPQNSCC